MKRILMLLCVLFLAVFIGAGIINSDSDPPCAELTEILNQMPVWDDGCHETATEVGSYEADSSTSVPIGCIIYGIIPDETQATDNRQSYGAGQNPKVIVVGSVDSFIYNGDLDGIVATQVAYPLIA